jgi:hypothetical protein
MDDRQGRNSPTRDPLKDWASFVVGLAGLVMQLVIWGLSALHDPQHQVLSLPLLGVCGLLVNRPERWRDWLPYVIPWYRGAKEKNDD